MRHILYANLLLQAYGFLLEIRIRLLDSEWAARLRKRAVPLRQRVPQFQSLLMSDSHDAYVD